MRQSRFSFIISLALALGCLLSLSTQPAEAYLDPGSGSYFLQMALAGVFAGLFALKMFWAQLKLYFLKLLHKDQPEPKS